MVGGLGRLSVLPRHGTQSRLAEFQLPQGRIQIAPGTRFYYDSGNIHLLSAILTKVTGKSALDYARETLFGPLGIEDVLWRSDPQGISGGGAGLYMHPRDMAKIGYLYLRDGVWEGQQILPASWIENVRKADVDMRETWTQNLRYGSQFWVMPGRDAYMAVGYDRQLIVVIPKLDIVAVTTGSARFAMASGLPTRPRYSFDSLVSFLTRAKGEGGHYRAADAGRRSAGDGEDDLRQDMAVPAQRHADQVHQLHARQRRAVLRIRGRRHSSQPGGALRRADRL